MRSQIEDGLGAQTDDFSLGRHRRLGLRDRRPSLDRGEQVLGTGGHPSNGPVELARERRRDDFFAVERPLHPEAPSDIRRDDA